MKCKCNMCQGTGKTNIVDAEYKAPCEKCDGWGYMIVSDDALLRQNNLVNAKSEIGDKK